MTACISSGKLTLANAGHHETIALHSAPGRDMAADHITRTLGISADEQVIVRQDDLSELSNDIQQSAEFMALLQDDVFASRLNAHLQAHTVRRIEKAEFVDASYGHVGQMIATLRDKGESHVFYHNGGIWGLDHRGPTDDLDAALRSVGWRALSDDEMRVLYSAPNLRRR
jgi:hypothetical protein